MWLQGVKETDLKAWSLICWQVPPLRQDPDVQRSNVSVLHTHCASTYAATPTSAVLLPLTTSGASLTTRTLLQPGDERHGSTPDDRGEHSSTGIIATLRPNSASIYWHTRICSHKNFTKFCWNFASMKIEHLKDLALATDYAHVINMLLLKWIMLKNFMASIL